MEFLGLLSNLDAHIAGFIAAHGNLIYLLLFSLVFLEIGIFPLFFLPGNPLIFIAGSFCKIGSLNFLLAAITLTIAAILGNLMSYQLGKVFGSKIKQGQSRWVNQNALNKTRNFYAKYGQLTLMLSPFIAVVRTFAPLLAGAVIAPSQSSAAGSRRMRGSDDRTGAIELTKAANAKTTTE